MTEQDSEMAAFMETKMEEDDEIMSAEIHMLISRHFFANILPPTIRRSIRKKLIAVRTRFGPMISERNNLKTQEFCMWDMALCKQCGFCEGEIDFRI